MNESITPQPFTGKNVVVIGGSKGVGRAVEDFVKGLGSSQTPEDVANAVVELASYPGSREGNVFLISGKGLETLP